MSLVTEVFDFVKTNPGTDGMQVQNHFSNNFVSDSLSDLESRNAIRWTKQGYYAMTQQLEEIKLSLDDCLEQLEKSLKANISTVCPKCNVFVKGKIEIDRIFGFRKCNGKVIPQSHCKKCRNRKSQKSPSSKKTNYPLQATQDFVSAKVAKYMKNNINIEGIVIQKETKKEFLVLSGCYRHSCTGYLIDENNDVVKFRLWGKDVLRIKNGSKIKLLRGYTKTQDGETSVCIGKSGLLEVVYYGERRKSQKTISYKPKVESDLFGFENCIIDASDDVLSHGFFDSFEKKRDDLKF
jgi:hypothetical protein